MRQKTLRLVVTFHTATAAMAMEAACMAAQIPGRLIPVPREITADCGMAWCAPLEARKELEAFIGAQGVVTAGTYELLV